MPRSDANQIAMARRFVMEAASKLSLANQMWRITYSGSNTKAQKFLPSLRN